MTQAVSDFLCVHHLNHFKQLVIHLGNRWNINSVAESYINKLEYWAQMLLAVMSKPIFTERSKKLTTVILEVVVVVSDVS